MRIVRLDQVGPPENLRVVEVPDPVPARGEVLIQVHLAGMIFGDMEARRGTYFKPTKLPYFPGREVAGEIVAIGEDVEHWSVGDRVIALITTYGCWAEYVIAATPSAAGHDGETVIAADIVKLPEDVSFELALPYLTNFRLAHMLFHGSSRVPAGATVLVHGASGGMGSMFIELARANGCVSIATCRTNQELTFCRNRGADHVISLIEQDYVAEVMDLTGGKGVAFSFNGIGGETLNRDFDALCPFGELQAYGYVAGKAAFDTFRLGKTISLKTFSANDFLGTEMFVQATAAMGKWLQSGNAREVDRILPLSDVVAANRLLENGEVMGKLALRP